MKTDIQLRHAVFIIISILLIVYSLYQARALLAGPQIWIESPQDGETVENPLVVIKGQAKNIAWISLNDRQIFTDENGKWSEKLIVSQGLSIMTVKARDRSGRETEEIVRIVLK
ncbi:MAG: hypothetical protein Q8Q92_02165 [bacterium]|nr:hypothetical protein [bacterium]